MAQDPLNVLWVEPNFPGRLGAVADWLVRRRGYRSWFYAHTADARSTWPPSVGKGLDLEVFGVGGVARDPAVTWSRALERGLCYAYGCWEVLEKNRPRPIDLIVGRSAGLGSSLFAPVYQPAAPVVTFLDYYYHAHRHDLAAEAGPDTPATYFHWRRSMAAIELLDLESCRLAWTPTEWQRSLYPAAYHDQILIQHDGIDTRRFARSKWHSAASGPRLIGGRQISDATRVVSFVARSVDRVRGFDRFLTVANALMKARNDVLCIVVGDPVVRRGLDVVYHSRDYLAHLFALEPPVDRDRFWLLGQRTPAVVAEVVAASDLHFAPGRPYPIARSLLEAMAAGCVVLASDTVPHREVIVSGQNGLLAAEADTEAMTRQALAALSDRAAFRPLGDAASADVGARFSQDICLPRLAEQFSALVAVTGAQR
jgi:glycosyltransferase involved in cell wall biosynthesis